MLYAQYWDRLNSSGWTVTLDIPGPWFVRGRYNYMDHAVWRIDHTGCLSIPSHENWVISWTVKLENAGQPAVITHYNSLSITNYHSHGSQVTCGGVFDSHAAGFVRATDPQTNGDPMDQFHTEDNHLGTRKLTAPGGIWPLWGFWGLYIGASKMLDGRRNTIEDTTSLTEMLFQNVDLSILPLIRQIDFYGNGWTLNVNLNPIA